MTNGDTYYFRVIAINEVDESDPSDVESAIPVTVPAKPVLNAPVVADSSLTVSWSAPNDGGSPITGYTLSITDVTNGNTFPDVSLDENAVDYTATQLTNGNEYSFTLIAINAEGSSDPSDAVVGVPLGAPDAIDDLAATPGDKQVTLNWSEPGLNGSGAIDYYTITYVDDVGATQTITVNSPTTTTTISSLTNGFEYTFSITATNVNDLTSDPDTATATPLGAPEQIDDLAATPGDGQVTLDWSEPGLNGSGAIDFYTVTVTDSQGTVVQTIEVDSPTTDALITGLTNGEQYTFSVTATNVNALTSDPDTATATPLGAPEQIDTLSTEPGDEQVTLNWTQPGLNNSGAIDFYTITYVDDEGVTQTVEIDAPTTTATITGLTNGFEYSFTITATNVNNLTSVPSTPATATPITTPNQPTELSATALSDSQINLTWTAPETDPQFGTLIGYQIERQAAGEPDFSIIVANTQSTSTTYLDTGLLSGIQYTYRVSAITTAGVGDASGTASATTFAVPDAPVLTVNAGDNTATVSWTTADNGTEITEYTLTITDTTDNATTTSTFDDAITQTTVALVNGHTYEFVVFATNSVGNGPDSNTVTVTPLGAPGAPANLTATPGDKQVSIDWEQPDLNNSGAIDYYTVTVTDSQGTVVDTIEVDSPTTDALITGLTNGEQYTFTVTATNVNELTSDDATATAVPLGAPLQITGLEATPGDRQVSLSWNPADENDSGDIQSYTIEVRDSSGALVDTITLTGAQGAPPATNTTVTGLTSGETYSFTVTATNENGLTSTPSDPATATPFGPPNAVTDLEATPGDRQVDLEWTEPIPNAGGAIDSYTIIVTDPNGNVVQTVEVDAPADAANIDGLNNGVEYTFTITATNVNNVTGAAATITAIPATAPLPPILDTADRGNQSVELSWTPQFDQGNAITQYTVEYSSNNFGTISTQEIIPVNGVLATTATISGLENGVDYQFRVIAHNEDDDPQIPDSSDPSEPVTGTPGTVPGIPTELVATTLSGTEIQLAWQAPSDNGGRPVTGYLIERIGANGAFAEVTTTTIPVPESPTAADTTFTDTGLSLGTTYTYRVSAVNVLGTGDPSDTDDTTTFDYPSAPVLDAAIRGNELVTLQWTTPSDNGGTPLQNYIAQFRLLGASDWTTFNDNIPLTPTEIDVNSGLTNGQTYQFRVIAENSVGESEASNILEAKPATTPSKPNQVGAEFGNQQVALDWQLPDSDGGEPIIDYIIEFRLASQTPEADWTTFNEGPNGVNTNLSVIVTGLANGQTYEFRVSAENDVDVGPPSDVSTATPATTANAPTDLSATAISGTAIDLEWIAPQNTGGFAITGYSIERHDGDGVFAVIATTSVSTPPSADDTTFNDTGLELGTTYTYRVSAITQLGAGTASGTASDTTFNVPDKPEITSATRGNAQVDLSWTEPANNGAAITAYLIQYSDNGTFDNTTPSVTLAVADLTELSTTIDGLENGEEYSFRIIAINSVGQSAPSDVATATPATVPDAPTITSTAFGDGQVTLTWTGPTEDGGSDVLDYTITITSSLGTDTLVVPNTPLTKLIDGLDNGVSYTFTISARNDVGSGPDSAPETVIPAAKPDVPTDLSATAISGTEIDLSWTAPANTGGLGITGYLIERHNGDGNFATVATTSVSTPPSTDDTTFNDTELSLGTTYTYRVSAITGAGTGSSSQPASDTTFNVPDKPTITEVNVGNTQLEIVWTAPTNNGGSPVTSYTVEYKLTTDNSWQLSPVPPADGALDVTVIGLENGKEYEFRVFAISSVGTSLPSDVATGIPATTPSAPLNVVATRGDTEVSLTWDLPADDGGSAIVDYLIEYASAELNLNFTPFVEQGENTNRFATVTGLTNGVEYTFRVQAVNGIAAGDYSTVTANSAAVPAGNPSTPVISTVIADDQLVNLTWLASNANGGNNLIYRIETSTDGFTTLIEDPAPTTSNLVYNVGGLQNGQEYSFRITAITDAGSSDPTAPVTATPFALPTAPVLDGSRGNTQVTLTWTQGDTGGFPIQEFVIEYTDDDEFDSTTPTTDDDVQSITVSANAVSHTITGLENGEDYHFRIFAKTSIGYSASSNVVELTPATTPGAPTPLNAQFGNQLVTLTFAIPTNNGGDSVNDFVIQYKLQSASTDTPFTTFADGLDTSTTVVVDGLTNGEVYDFRVLAVNDVGQSDPATASAKPATTPGAPEALQLDFANQLVSLEWATPTDDGGDAIADYIVEYSLDTEEWIVFPDNVDPATTTAVTVTDLINGFQYYFRISGSNIAGIGEPSEFRATTPATLPSAPRDLEATRDNTSVHLTWNAPDNLGGAPLSAYMVEYLPPGQSTWIKFGDDLPATQTNVTVDGLTNGDQYQFRVTAKNTAITDFGPASNTVSATPATTPTAPRNLVVTAGDNQATLSWDVPESNGGDAIIDYKIEIRIAGQDWDVFDDGISTVTQGIVIPNLTNGVTYEFRVTAINSVNPGPESDVIPATPATIPTPPKKLVIIPGDTKLDVDWTEPTSDGGSAITEYRIQYSIDGTFDNTTPTVTLTDLTNLMVTISGLVNDTPYHIQVTAINGVGSSEPAGPVVGVPSLGSSSPVGLFADATSDTEVFVSWSPPQELGERTLDGFILERLDANGNVLETFTINDPTKLDFTDTGLLPGTDYKYQVSAILSLENSPTVNSEPSSRASVTTLAAPGIPLNPSAIPRNAHVDVSWTAPSDGGSIITEYRVQYSTDGTFDETTPEVSVSGTSNEPPQTSVDVTGLVNDQEYTFRIIAVTAIDTGLPSSAVTATPYTVPDTPSNLTAQRGPGEAKLNWEVPNDNGRSITQYTVEYTDDADGVFTTANTLTTTVSGSQTSTTVTGLGIGKSFAFRVSAENLAGQGPSSDSAMATPATAPGAPINLQATRGDPDALVIWFEPPNDGGSPISHYVLEYISSPFPIPPGQADFSSKTNVITEATSVELSDLENGLYYSFRVRAISTVGSSVPTDPVCLVNGGSSSTGACIPMFDRPQFNDRIVATPFDGAAEVRWNTPATDNGSPVVSYQVQQQQVSGTSVTLQQIPQSQIIYGFDDISSDDLANLEEIDFDEFDFVDFGDLSQTEIQQLQGITSLVITGLENEQKYVFEIAPVNEAGPARSTNTVVVVPHMETDENEDATFVENPDIPDQETIQKQIDLGLLDDNFIPPSSSLVDADKFDFFDETFNQNQIFNTNVTDAELEKPKDLADKFGLTQYKVPDELGTDQIWAVPGAIIEVEGDETFEEIVLPDPPGTPTNLVGIGTDGRIDLTWDDSTGTVDRYLLELSLDDGSEWLIVEEKTDNIPSFSKSGIVNGKDYLIRVSAVNSGGQSDPTSPITVRASTIPDSPFDISTQFGNGQVTVLWNAPLNDGGLPLSTYVVEYTDDENGVFDENTSSVIIGDDEDLDTQVIISGLENGIEYTFHVIATNANGPSIPSNTASDIPATQSSRPTGLSVTPALDSIAISWTAPQDIGGATGISGYVIERSISSGFLNVLVDDTGSDSTAYVDASLFSGTDYSYRIAAITLLPSGESVIGDFSGEISTTTLDLPDEPTSLEIFADKGQLTITWIGPEDTSGLPVLGYEIERRSTGAEFVTVVENTESTETVYTDTGLSDNTSYTYRISTITAAGTSDPSQVERGTTFGLPSAPLDLAADAVKSKVRLSWTAPVTDGGSVITDYKIEYKLETDPSWSTFNDGTSVTPQTTVTSLTNNNVYQFRVSAVNEFGSGLTSETVDAKPSVAGATAAYSIQEIPSGQDVFLPHNADDTLENGGKLAGLKIKPKNTLSELAMTSTFTKDAPTGVTQEAAMYLKFELDFVEDVATDASVPGQVESVVATASAGKVEITWNAPSDDGGADITGYKIEQSTDGNTWTVLETTNSQDTDYTDNSLENGQTYHYRISAVNQKGTGTASATASATPLDVPGPPRNLQTAPGNAQVTLTWDIPSTDNGLTVDNGGAAITGYVVHYAIDTNFWKTFNEELITERTATVTGLTNGENYKFRVFAVNQVGFLNPSLVSSEIPLTVADRPWGLTATAISQNQINITWETPLSDGGSPITGYKIQRVIGETNANSVWSDAPSGTLGVVNSWPDTNLIPGTTYSYRVIPLTAAAPSGDSNSASGAIFATTLSVPAAPRNLTLEAEGQKIIVDWNIPTDNGGTPIINYLIQWSDNGGNKWNTMKRDDSTVTSATVKSSNIVLGTEYQIRVYAENAIGPGPASSTESITPTTVPTAPRSLVTDPEDGQVIVSWSAPLSNGGSPITDYVIKYKESGNSQFVTFADGTSTSTTATVTGLTNDVTYEFRVIAVNAVGNSPASTGKSVAVGAGNSSEEIHSFESIQLTILMGPVDGSVHPTIPENSATAATADPSDDIIAPDVQVYFINDNNETIFDGITVTRHPAGDTLTESAYLVTLEHFSTYGVNTINSKFAVGSAGLATAGAGGNTATPPVITGASLYSFGDPSIDNEGKIVYQKTGNYVPFPEYSNTVVTSTLETGKPSQIAARIFNSGGPEAVQHTGLYLNLLGEEFETEHSDTYIEWSKDFDGKEEVQVKDPNGLMSNVGVSTQIEGDLLWVLFDLTFEKELETSHININAWNNHRSIGEAVAYNALEVIDPIQTIIGTETETETLVATDSSFYLVESTGQDCEEYCYLPYSVDIIDNEITWTNTDPAVRTVISGEPIAGFDGNFKSVFIFAGSSYSTVIEDSGYYTTYDLLEENYASTMLVEVSGDPITDARIFEKSTMPTHHTARQVVSANSDGLLGVDVTTNGFIKLFGTIEGVDTRHSVLVDIAKPDGSVESMKTSSNSAGDFTMIYEYGELTDGNYVLSFGTATKDISSIFLRVDAGKIIPTFTPQETVIESAETVAKSLNPELVLSNTNLSQYDDTLYIDGTIDSNYATATVSVEFPDKTIQEFKVKLSSHGSYSLPLKQGE